VTKRSNEYKRNRRFDVWVLVAVVVLLLADPEWLGAPDEVAAAPWRTVNLGEN
jgi:hypothetical protein